MQKKHSASTFAVLFKVHAWDSFIERQLDRLRQCVADKHIYVVFDTTNEKYFPNTICKTLEISEREAREKGFVCFPEKNAFWYNNDYPLFLFLDQHPYFEYVVIVEYDCVVRVSIESIVAKMEDSGIQFVGECVRSEMEMWYWTPSIQPHYPENIHFVGRLACFSVFSNKFANSLKKKRLELSSALRSDAGKISKGDVSIWPFGEALIGAEIAFDDIKNLGLQDFGTTSNYDWAPHYLERQIDGLKSDFVHPVLDEDRFIKAIFKKLPWHPQDLFAPYSPMSVWFSNIPIEIIAPVMLKFYAQHKDESSIAKLEHYAEARGWQIDKRLVDNWKNWSRDL